MPLDINGDGFHIYCYHSLDSDNDTNCASSCSSNSTVGNKRRDPDALDQRPVTPPPPPPPAREVPIEVVTFDVTETAPCYAVITNPNDDVPNDEQARQYANLNFLGTSNNRYSLPIPPIGGIVRDLTIRMWYYKNDTLPGGTVITAQFAHIAAAAGTTLIKFQVEGNFAANFHQSSVNNRLFSIVKPVNTLGFGWQSIDVTLSVAPPFPSGSDVKIELVSYTTTVPVGYEMIYHDFNTITPTVLSGPTVIVGDTSGWEPGNTQVLQWNLRDPELQPFYGLPPVLHFTGRVEQVDPDGDAEFQGGRGYSSNLTTVLQSDDFGQLEFGDYNTTGNWAFKGASGGDGRICAFRTHKFE